MSDSRPNDVSQCQSTPLRTKLKETRIAKLTEAGHVESDAEYEPKFFPADVIEVVLSRDAVKSVLGCLCDRCGEHANYLPPSYERRTIYLDYVMSDALKLFALLVFMEHPALIGAFVRQRKGDHILDENLKRIDLKNTYLTEIESNSRLTAVEIRNLLDSFLELCYQFSPPVFKGSWFEEWDPKTALPFINTTYIGEGGYGKVYSFQIYPGYKRFVYGDSVSAHPLLHYIVVLKVNRIKTKFAMKEVGLAAGPIGCLNAEAQNLSKIRDELEDEKHIIKVLKIFRRGQKIHFIFPLAEGNLADLMSKPWRHLPTSDKAICWNSIWDQAVGMLKALARFHSPPEQARWRGYHSDIKRTYYLLE